MIDRKVLWISITLIAAMTAAAIWRLSLLPDWQHVPLDGPDSKHVVNGIVLFLQPISLAWATGVFYGRKWFATGSGDAVQSWRNWQTMFIVAFCLLLGVMQTFIISRSLGYGLAVDRQLFARGAIAATGILIMVAGNALPKLPGLSSRLRWFHLDPWQQNRHMRFTGKIMVGMGLYFVLLAICIPLLQQLPQSVRLPVMLAPGLVMVPSLLWHRARLKREPSPLS